ncbi:XrtA/PEP-CTERM system TPR-repeat protein PrsT [Colwellia echini]|uniref:PEP-CTERM system TPR-repeat protein PrsT n=1 Tax=Colwellia echini TaxID=1982103 RepID=A0ABY3MTX8_9GAMM|nr:XrtA/PEP-CTERM system TPR-repeat protein PrsT [Colwellia echini]TYK64635.1 PEP-CTERM system TPR-repeat protein PrsT [Colwellia echini]
MFNNLLAFLFQKALFFSVKTRVFLILFTLISSNVFAQNSAINQSYEDALQAFYQAKYQTSIIHLKNILQLDSNHLPSRVLMAENLLQQGKASAAEVELKFASAAGADNMKIMPLLARAYLIQNNYQFILDIYIPENSPDNYKSIMQGYVGYAYLGQRDYPQATAAFTQSLTLSPNNVDALLGLAKVSIQQEDSAHALSLIKQVLTIEPNNKQALLMASITYKLTNDLSAALTTINQLILLDDKNYSALLTRSMLLSGLGEDEQAAADLDIILDHFPNEPIANYVRLISSPAQADNEASKKLELHLMSILASIPAEYKNEQPVFLFLTGLVNFQNNAMENAQQTLLKYHKKAPNDIAAIKLLARSQMALGDYFQAKKHLIKAHFLDEADVEIWALLARTYMMTDELDKADFYFKKVHNSNPTDLTAIIDLATLYLLNDDVIAIQKLLEPATKIASLSDNIPQQTQILFMLIKALQETNSLDEAMLYSQQLLKVANNNTYAHQIQGNILALQGKIAPAKAAFIRAIELDESNFQAVMFLARIEALLGNINSSIALLKTALESGPNSALYIELGDVYQGINNTEASMTWYQKGLAKNPSSILALNKIVAIHLADHQLEQAVAITENYIQKFDNNEQAHLLLAQLYQQSGWYQKALTQMNQYVKLATNRAVAFYQLAQLQLVNNDTNEAELSLQKSIAWQSDYQPAYLLLLSLYNKLDTATEAEEKSLKLINALSAVSADKSLIAQLTADLYWSINQENKALNLYQQSYTIKANRAALLGLFRIYRSNKQYVQISKLLTEWLNKNPDDLTLAISLAENYRLMGDLAKASSYYQTLVENNSDNPVLLNNAAIVYRELKQYDQAAELIDRAYQLMPQNIIILDTKAWIEFHRGNVNNALALLRKANTLDYENAEVKYHLAVTLAALQRKTEARKYLQESVSSEQTYPEKSQAKALLSSWR